MTNLATLGIAIDSGSAVTASNSLDQMAKSARAAETQAEALSRATHIAAAGTGDLASSSKTAVSAHNAHTAAMKAQAAAATQLRMRQQQLMYQYNDVFVSLASGMNPMMVAIQQGSQLGQVYAGNGGLSLLLKETAKGAVSLARALGPVAIASGVAAAATWGLTDAIQRTSGEAVTMGDVVLGTFGAIADDIGNTIAPAINLMGQLWGDNFNTISSVTGNAVNFVVRAILLGFEDVRLNLEKATIAIGGTVNNILFEFQKPINDMLASVSFELNKIILLSNQFAGTNFTPISPSLDALKPREIEEELVKAGLDGAARVAEIMRTDYAENIYQYISEAAVTHMRERIEKETKEARDKAAKAAADAFADLESLAQRYEESRIQAQGDVIQLIEYRKQKDLEAIEAASQAAIDAGNDQFQVLLLQTQAEMDVRMATEQKIADYRIEQAEKARRAELALQRELIQLREEGRRLDSSIGLSTAEDEIGWEAQNRLEQAQAIRDRELELYGNTQAERERINAEYRARELAIEKQAIDEVAAYRLQKQMEMLGAASGFFGAMGNLAQAFGDDQNKAAQALFAVQKSLNLAMALMNAWTSYTQAWADPTLPYMAKIAASINALTTVLNAVAQIRSVNLSGAREMGGPVNAGGTYLVGERGPELFTAGASGQITSNANLQRAMNGSASNDNGGPAQAQVTLRVPEGWDLQLDEQAKRIVRVEKAQDRQGAALVGMSRVMQEQARSA